MKNDADHLLFGHTLEVSTSSDPGLIPPLLASDYPVSDCRVSQARRLMPGKLESTPAKRAIEQIHLITIDRTNQMHIKPGSVLLAAVTMMFVGSMGAYGNAGQVVLYVANTGSGTITDYSQSGSYLGVFASGLDAPGNLTVDKAGDVLVSTAQGFNEYSPTGALLLSVPTTFALGQIQVAANGNLLVNSYYGGDVLEYSAGGQYVGIFSNPGLQRAYYSALDAEGNLYITDHFSGVIEKISPTGVVEGALGGAYLPGVAGIAFDSKGDLFAVVATYSFEGIGANSIVEFSANGTYLGIITYLGLENPTGLAVGPDGNLYVADYQGNTIAEYSPSGAFLGTFTSTNLDGPHGIAFSAGSVPEPSSAVMLVIAVMAGPPFIALRRRRRLSLTSDNSANSEGCRENIARIVGRSFRGGH